MLFDDFVAVPESSAWLDDDLDSGIFGRLCNGLISRAAVCVGVLFKD